MKVLMPVRQMILTVLLVFLVTFPLQSTAQDLESNFIENERLTPPGTRLLREGRYLDETEISNIAWLEFLFFAARDSSATYYQSMLPDTTVWNDLRIPLLQVHGFSSAVDSVDQNEYLENYLRYPGYRYYPVVGVSYDQAKAYCKWRSAAVNITLNGRLQQSGKKYRVKYNYSIPNISDLQFASSELVAKQKLNSKTARIVKKRVLSFQKNKEFWKAAVKQSIASDERGKDIFVSSINIIGYIYDNGNSKYFYNLIGNVSEMTNQEGTSYGGSWIHSIEEINVLKTFPYRKPEYWLGFRCVCTVDVIR
jgi:hypothetical protein